MPEPERRIAIDATGQRHPLTEDEKADLVAYLDGELDEASPRAARSEAGRRSADAAEEPTALRRTWEMLDYLPRPTTSVTFTSRTLERMSVFRPVTASSVLAGLRGPWALGVGSAAVVVVAGTVGFEAVSWKMRRAAALPVAAAKPVNVDQQLVRNIRIIEHKRLYEQVNNITSCANWTIRIYSETTTSW